jgi:hypothetical protein
VKQRNQPLLQLCGEINQEVAAGDQIQLGERGIHDDVLRCKHHHLPDLFGDAKAALLVHEEPAQALRRHVGRDRVGVQALARLFDGLTIEIGAEDLQGDVADRPERLCGLLEHHGQRVGLFPRGATGHPGSERAIAHVAGQERGQGVVQQRFPALRVAEEGGHSDQQLFEQELDLARILAQKAHVVAEGIDLMQPHAAFDAAQDGRVFVQRKIVTGVAPKQNADLLQRTPGLVFGLAGGSVDVRGVLAVRQDLGGQLLYWSDDVGQTRLDRAPGHAVVFGRGRGLYERRSCVLLDRAQPQRAIRAHAGQDHADAALLLIIGQGAKEEVDRQMHPASARRLKQVQLAAQQR